MSRSFTIFIALSAIAFITYVAYGYFNRPRFVGGVVAIHTGTLPGHGVLGVTFGLPPNEMILTSVLEDGPAGDAGIEVGDHLIGIEGERTETGQHFLSVIRDTSPGDVVAIQFQRDGHEKIVDVVLCDALTIRELNLERRLQQGFLVPVSEP
ncbi:PDZ domain-containing protein [Planctomycetes bacterium TBK1r]|uniref:PDZ domain-containing protein n=1 Tax=Stieleria magnilauensis TaxID=2527963 RepID=UPI0011A1F945